MQLNPCESCGYVAEAVQGAAVLHCRSAGGSRLLGLWVLPALLGSRNSGEAKLTEGPSGFQYRR